VRKKGEEETEDESAMISCISLLYVNKIEMITLSLSLSLSCCISLLYVIKIPNDFLSLSAMISKNARLGNYMVTFRIIYVY
jgi:hypothetical protein